MVATILQFPTKRREVQTSDILIYEKDDVSGQHAMKFVQDLKDQGKLIPSEIFKSSNGILIVRIVGGKLHEINPTIQWPFEGKSITYIGSYSGATQVIYSSKNNHVVWLCTDKGEYGLEVTHVLPIDAFEGNFKLIS